MDLIYGSSAYERARGDFPFLKIKNMFAEETSTEANLSLISRPGLTVTTKSVTSGEVKAIFQVDGVLSNAFVVVSGVTVYVNGTNVGTIDGTGEVSIDGYENRIFINAGLRIWTYDGTTLSVVAFPDSASVLKILVANSRLLAIRKDTGGFYWSNPLTTTIGGLNFATAEASPDRLLDFVFIGSSLILFGSETIEFWQTNDNADAPFLPLIGRVFNKGVTTTGAATRIGGNFAWITTRGDICLNDPDTVVSNYSIQEKIAGSSSAILWVFELEGTEFLALRLDTETWVLNSRTQYWSEFASYGKTNWLARCYGNGYLGSSESGQVFQWGSDYYDLGAVLERDFTAWASINTGGVTINNLSIRTNPGHTPVVTGTYSDPVVEMRSSRDGGYTWGSWRRNSLGRQGDYRRLIRWIGLGMFSFPGVMVEIRVTDPVPFRVSSVSVNDSYGGF